jgi:hypothetical protein
VTGALSKHAKWVIRSGNQPQENVRLAWTVLRTPDAYAVRFGIAALTEPTYDATEATEEIADTAIQDTIAELWAVMTAAELET